MVPKQGVAIAWFTSSWDGSSVLQITAASMVQDRAAAAMLQRHEKYDSPKVSSGTKMNWPTELPDVAMPMANPRRSSKTRATAVEITWSLQAAKPRPPTKP